MLWSAVIYHRFGGEMNFAARLAMKRQPKSGIEMPHSKAGGVRHQQATLDTPPENPLRN